MALSRQPAASRRTRTLDEPRKRADRRYDSEALGRGTEAIARFFGTGRYIALQSGIVAIWIAVTVYAGIHNLADNRSFRLLNLVFSAQAAYAAPMILLGQNREADRDRRAAERDRSDKARHIAETEFLARELADVRYALEQKIDRDDIGRDGEITAALDRLRELLDIDEVPDRRTDRAT